LDKLLLSAILTGYIWCHRTARQ